MMGASLIGKGLDGVLASRLETRVDGAEHRTHYCDGCGYQPPNVNDGLDQRTMDNVINRESSDVREQYPKYRSGDGQKHGLAQKNVQNVAGRRAQRFQDA